jgi:protein gp37
MGEITAISWCDHTFNPWIGCTKISPACDGCYAENLMDKRYGRVQWGAPGKGNGTRARTSKDNWRQPIRWNQKAKEAGTRPFVFCSSLADVFDNQVPEEWREDLFELIRITPRLVWLLLTKRPQNIIPLIRDHGAIAGNGTRYLPGNAALGTTIEDQRRHDVNSKHLRFAKTETGPLFTFFSMEPLLGPVDMFLAHGDRNQVDWVITGGETDQGGHRARPTHPDWYRGLRDQCEAAGVAYHHKQNGEFSDFDHIGMAWNDLPDSIRIQQQFVNGKAMIKIGKHRSGRLLDGVEHNARPEVA